MKWWVLVKIQVLRSDTVSMNEDQGSLIYFFLSKAVPALDALIASCSELSMPARSKLPSGEDSKPLLLSVALLVPAGSD